MNKREKAEFSMPKLKQVGEVALGKTQNQEKLSGRRQANQEENVRGGGGVKCRQWLGQHREEAEELAQWWPVSFISCDKCFRPTGAFLTTEEKEFVD